MDDHRAGKIVVELNGRWAPVLHRLHPSGCHMIWQQSLCGRSQEGSSKQEVFWD